MAGCIGQTPAADTPSADTPTADRPTADRPTADTPAADDCPKKCNYIYSPVCGRDQNGVQKTFSNECVLKIENCKYHNSKFLVFF